MPEKQRMLDGTLVPTRKHYDDPVECADGTIVMHGEAFYDCRDNPHCTEEARNDSDITIVEEILDAHVEWADEYATENDDYTSDYDHIVSEVSHDWPGYVKEWIRDNYPDNSTSGLYSIYEDCMDRIVELVCDDLDGPCIDAEWEYNSNEYAAYSGSGCCLWGFDIGECEEQVDVKAIPELAELHGQERLRDILGTVNCNAYIGSMQYSLRGDYPCFEFYHSPGGRWDCVVSEDRMRQAVTTGIIEYCRESIRSS